MALEVESFSDPDTLAAATSAVIADSLSLAIAARGAASLVCSGGTTPGPVYERLSEADLVWSAVQVTGSDERWLPPEDPSSLEHLLRAHLFRNRAAAARFTPLKTAHAEPEEGEAEVGARLAAMPLPFDVVLLGMGGDAHTASLFPGAPDLKGAMDMSDPALARAVRAPTSVISPARMSLTLRALLQSRLIVLLFRGRDKFEVFEEARRATDHLASPVSAILQQDQVPVRVHWAP